MKNEPYAHEAPVRRVTPLLVVLLAAIGVVLAAVYGLSRSWGVDGDEALPGRPLRGVSPSLETAPQPALRDYLAQKERIAGEYSWVDPARQIARIPIEEAMRALAAPSLVSPESQAAFLMGTDKSAPSSEKASP